MRKVKPYQLLFAAALGCLFLFSCGHDRTVFKKETSRPIQPRWLNALPQEEGYAHVVGIKTGAKNLEEGKQAAQQNAAAQVSGIIATKIISSQESRLSYDSETGERQLYNEQIEAMTTASVENLVCLDECHEKSTRIVGGYYEQYYDVYVLCRFPLAAAEKERQRIAEEQRRKAEQAAKLALEAKTAERSGKLYDAYTLISQSRELIKDVPPSTPLDNGDFKSAADVFTVINAEWRKLDARARSIAVKIQAQRINQRHSSIVESAVTEALSTTNVNVASADEARFILVIRLSVQPSGRVLNQLCVRLHYDGALEDSWQNNTRSGLSGTVKGFGKTIDDALFDALRNAGKEIGKKISASAVNTFKNEKQTGEKEP